MSSKPVVLEEIRHPTRFQLYHVPPEIPFRRAKEFRLKRRKLIHEGVAETVDFRDILSRSRRFLGSGNHSFPAKKPVVIESRVAAALNQQGNKSSISGRPDTAVQLGYFKLYGQFGHDSSAMQSDERCIVDSGWPDYKYESAESLHESRLFDDVTSRNVTGAAEDHRSLLLSSCVKQYKPQMTNGCITWSDDFETICDPTVSSSADTFEEPFRDVPQVLREIIRERLHLLESHLVNVHEKDSTTNVNVDVGLDTNDIDIGAITDDNFNPEDLAASCGITEDEFLYDNTTGRERNQNMRDHDDENDNISSVKKSEMFSNIQNSCPAVSSDQKMESVDQDLMPDWTEVEPVKENNKNNGKKNENDKNDNENENNDNDEDDIYNTGYYDNNDGDGDEYDSDENSCGGRSDDVIIYGGGSPTLGNSNTSENEESKCDRVTNETDYDEMSVDDNAAGVNQIDEEDIYNINYFSSSKKENAPKKGKNNAKIKIKEKEKEKGEGIGIVEGKGKGQKEGKKKETAPKRNKNKIKEDEMEIDYESKYSDSDSDSDSIGMAVNDNDNNQPTTQPHTKKVKIQIKSEHSLPDGIFETAARKILFPIDAKNDARKHRKHAKNVLLNKEHSSTSTPLPLPSCPDDVASLVGELYDNQVSIISSEDCFSISRCMLALCLFVFIYLFLSMPFCLN